MQRLQLPVGKKIAKLLQERGFGLVTVDPDGDAHVLFPAIPLVQVIPEASFKQQLKGLPKAIRQATCEAYEDYRAKTCEWREDVIGTR